MFSINSPTKRLSLPLQAKLHKASRKQILMEEKWKKIVENVSSNLSTLNLPTSHKTKLSLLISTGSPFLTPPTLVFLKALELFSFQRLA